MNEPHASLALAPTIGIVGVLYFSHAIKLLFAECSFKCKPMWVHRQRTPRGTVAQGGGGMRQKNMRTVSYVNVQMHRDPDSLHFLRHIQEDTGLLGKRVRCNLELGIASVMWQVQFCKRVLHQC